MRRPARWLTLLTLVGALVAAVAPAHAQDIPTFDVNTARTRTVFSTAYDTLHLDPVPFYMPVPADPNGGLWQSYATPVMVGTDVYQYAYDSSGHAVLWEFDASNTTQYGTALPPGCQPYQQTCTVNWPLVNQYTWDPGWYNQNGYHYNEADEVAAPTVGQGYVAIGVGQNEYWWPEGAPQSAEQWVQIPGNPGQDIYQVSMSPLITPPVTWSGLDAITGQTVSWQSPAAVVGSWDGGVVSTPVYTPNGVFAQAVHYTTYEDFHHTGAFITSSPTWVPSLNAVVFGISTPGTLPTYHPRVVIFNPVTGAHSYFGVGIIRASVDSSVVLGSNGNLYVPDQQGGIYEFTPQGQLVAQQQALSSAQFDISNLAVSPNAVYAVGNGLTDLASLDPRTLRINWIDNNFGISLYSPSVVNDGSTDTVFVLGLDGRMWMLNQQGQVLEAANSTLTQAYVSALADAGPSHWAMTWTDYDTLGQPALEIWAATAAYTVTGTLNPNPAAPNQEVTITAWPVPAPLTSAVEATVPTASGPATLMLSQDNATTWVGLFPAPPSPGSYPVTITAIPTQGSPVQALLTLQVEANSVGPPTNAGTLTLQSFQKPGHQDPEPTGDTKLGDTIVATLTVPTSDFTAAMPPNCSLQAATITQATLVRPNGVDDFTATHNSLIVTVNQAMTPSGLTATASFLENWSGFPPPIPPAWYTWQGWVTADWTVQGSYACVVTHRTVDKNGTVHTWTTTYTQPFTTTGSAGAPLTVIGTDWYVIPVPVQGTDQYN